ncbi:MAG: sigma-70 family RNA polymerase sigma factor [Reichenbachiella sp.]
MEEVELVDYCQAGNSSAQRTLYKKYVNKMYHTCIRYLPDQMEAEDVVTEGFVKVFRKIYTFEYRGKGSLEGWIKRIMINESLMALRKKRHVHVDIEGFINIESGLLTDSQLDYREILKVIYSLPKGYRTVFNLYVIEGFSHNEIASKLSISENTSKSQLSKARASLLKKLKHNGIL